MSNAIVKKIRFLNGESFKCPLCGNEEFLEDDFRDDGDMGSRHVAKSYSCLNCAYMFLIDDTLIPEKEKAEKDLKPLFNKLKKENTEYNKNSGVIKEEMARIKETMDSLREEAKDPNRTFKRDAEIKEELKELNEKWAVNDSKLNKLEYKVREAKQKIERYLNGELQYSRLKNYYYSQYSKLLAKIE